MTTWTVTVRIGDYMWSTVRDIAASSYDEAIAIAQRLVGGTLVSVVQVPRNNEPRRALTATRFSADEVNEIAKYAVVETGGNWSAMLRRLVAEALTARRQGEK